ncbi:MAG: hypothetical protein K8M05_40680 [Deltaproteobacteria bacterium]|nr:hypothetical protein [Kofleriaceae bacterium]
MRRSFVVLALLVLPAAPGCDSHLDAEVGGALLPQALDVMPPGDGPTIVVLPGKPAPALPAGPVKLAVDHAVPWRELGPLLAAADQAGAQPTLLVGQRDRIRGFRLSDELRDEYTLRFQPTSDGKFCLSPPATREAYCVQTGTRRHVSAAFVRAAVQKAVAAYGITQGRVVPDADTRWGDIVRSIDGARTCCKEPFRVAVSR